MHIIIVRSPRFGRRDISEGRRLSLADICLDDYFSMLHFILRPHTRGI